MNTCAYCDDYPGYFCMKGGCGKSMCLAHGQGHGQGEGVHVLIRIGDAEGLIKSKITPQILHVY